MPNKKPGVMIYFETAKAIKGLDNETVGRLFKAIMEYAEDGVIPEFDGVLSAVWPFVADKIERDSIAYSEKVEKKKRAAYKKWWKRYAFKSGIDPDDEELMEEWIDCQMEKDADAMQSNAKDADASDAMQKMPTVSAAGNGNAAGNGSAYAGAKPTRHKYGEYKNVLLTDEELSKLQAEFPGDWKERIERLSEYIESTGKRYKSHLATIRSWAKKDSETERKTPISGNPCDHITLDDYMNDSEHPW